MNRPILILVLFSLLYGPAETARPCIPLTIDCTLRGERRGPSRIVVRLTDGSEVHGYFLGLDASGSVRIQDKKGRERQLSAAEVLLIRFVGVARESKPPQGHLRFRLGGGGVMHGLLLKGTYDDVEVETAAFGRFTLPLERLEWLEVPSAVSRAPSGFAKAGPMDRDVLFLQRASGVDHVVGEVARLAKDAVVFEWGGRGETRFENVRDKVVAVRLSEPEVAPVTKALLARVESRDGSVLYGQLLKPDERSLSLRLPWGKQLSVDESQVVALTFEGGPVVSLSGLTPRSINETPYIEGGLTYGLHVDESLQGGEPHVGGVAFPRALVVHSRCELVYSIPEGASSFVSAIGIDDAVKGRRLGGSVAMSVVLDGKVVYEPTVCHVGQAPRWIPPVDLKGGKELRLIADFGKNAHFNGHAVWGLASFIINQ